MPMGAGKYDELTTAARDAARAAGVILIVIKGKYGSGLSVQATAAVTLNLPEILRDVANEIEASMREPPIKGSRA